MESVSQDCCNALTLQRETLDAEAIVAHVAVFYYKEPFYLSLNSVWTQTSDTLLSYFKSSWLRITLLGVICPA